MERGEKMVSVVVILHAIPQFKRELMKQEME
jgi:hypothetical protein